MEHHIVGPLCFHFHTIFSHLGAKFYLFLQGTLAILSIPCLEQEKVISLKGTCLEILTSPCISFSTASSHCAG